MTPHHEAMVARHREVRARLFPSKPPVVPAWRVAKKFESPRSLFMVEGKHKSHKRMHYPQPIGPRLSEVHTSHNSHHYGEPIGPVRDFRMAYNLTYSYRATYSVGGVKTESLPKLPRLTCAAIITEVARFYGLSIADVKGTYRTTRCVIARHVAYYLCRGLLPVSMPQIGRAFEGRDHTTIMHGVSKVSRLIKTDLKLACEIEEIRQILASLYSRGDL